MEQYLPSLYSYFPFLCLTHTFVLTVSQSQQTIYRGAMTESEAGLSCISLPSAMVNVFMCVVVCEQNTTK